jgi:hypothetical protein
MSYTIPAGRYPIDIKQSDIDAVVGLAPATLDTLDELAAALNDDPNLVTTLSSRQAAALTALGIAAGDTTLGTFTSATLTDNANLKTVLNAFASAYDAYKTDRSSYFEHESNITKVKNPTRSSNVNVGNNIELDPATGYKVQIQGGLYMDNNAKIDANGGITMRTSPTSPPSDGDIYFDKNLLALKVYVDDGNSQQWVQL